MPATPPTRPACLPSHRPPGRSLVTRVVIVGGGPAGLAAYRAILRACGSAVRSGELHLSVISGTPDFRAPGLNADVLAGHLTAQHLCTPLRRLVPRATVLVGRMAQADLTMQRLQVSRADHSPCWLGFDHLILSDDQTVDVTVLRGDRQRAGDLIVVTDGRPPVLPGTESLPRDGRGFLLTDATLRVPDPANVWAARTPAQGAHAGQNVARALRRREARPVPDGQWTARSVRLGHWNAVTRLRLLPTPTGGGGRSLILRGRLGWLARTLLLSAVLPRPADRLRVALALLRPARPDTPAAPRTTDRPTPV